jgi:hypothetical protein
MEIKFIRKPSLVTISTEKKINDLEQNGRALLDEVHEDGVPTMLHHHEIEDSAQVE